MNRDQLSLFSPSKPEKSGKKALAPLAHRARPKGISEFMGASKLLKRYPFLENQGLTGVIFYGPPGCGKTTLTTLLAKELNRELYSFNAVLSGVGDLKKLISRAQEMELFSKKRFIIFIDEIHRFNKAQQDALLPFVEKGEFILFGATTENPKRSIIGALLSRVQLVELPSLSKDNLKEILLSACKNEKIEVPNNILELIANYSECDARRALNHLEIVLEKRLFDPEILKDLLKRSARVFDKGGDRHYDVISAFIKSIRGSDVNASILWLAVMLDGGEDPIFIARRLVIFASEDIGNANSQALLIAQAAMQTVSQIGMPEARITLAHAVSYMALSPKSNAAYLSINEALSFVQDHETIEVPTHLRNTHPDKQNYLYPHNYDNHLVQQDYTGIITPDFYKPTEQGDEKYQRKRMDDINC